MGLPICTDRLEQELHRLVWPDLGERHGARPFISYQDSSLDSHFFLFKNQFSGYDTYHIITQAYVWLSLASGGTQERAQAPPGRGRGWSIGGERGSEREKVEKRE